MQGQPLRLCLLLPGGKTSPPTHPPTHPRTSCGSTAGMPIPFSMIVSNTSWSLPLSSSPPRSLPASLGNACSACAQRRGGGGHTGRGGGTQQAGQGPAAKHAAARRAPAPSGAPTQRAQAHLWRGRRARSRLGSSRRRPRRRQLPCCQRRHAPPPPLAWSRPPSSSECGWCAPPCLRAATAACPAGGAARRRRRRRPRGGGCRRACCCPPPPPRRRPSGCGGPGVRPLARGTGRHVGPGLRAPHRRWTPHAGACGRQVVMMGEGMDP